MRHLTSDILFLTICSHLMCNLICAQLNYVPSSSIPSDIYQVIFCFLVMKSCLMIDWCYIHGCRLNITWFCFIIFPHHIFDSRLEVICYNVMNLSLTIWKTFKLAWSVYLMITDTFCVSLLLLYLYTYSHKRTMLF